MDAYQEGWEACRAQVVSEVRTLRSMAPKLADQGVRPQAIRITQATLEGVEEYVTKIECPPVSSR